jgi:hypothetical protein
VKIPVEFGAWLELSQQNLRNHSYSARKFAFKFAAFLVHDVDSEQPLEKIEGIAKRIGKL